MYRNIHFHIQIRRMLYVVWYKLKFEALGMTEAWEQRWSGGPVMGAAESRRRSDWKPVWCILRCDESLSLLKCPQGEQ